MKTPEKIYLYPYSTDGIYEVETKPLEGTVEYTRTNVLIKMACEKLEKCMYDNLMFQGRLHRKEVIETFIKDFKEYMEEEI